MAVDNQQAPTVIKLHLKQSKTDLFGRGADIVLGKTGCNLYPVAAILGYVEGSKAFNKAQLEQNQKGTSKTGPYRPPICGTYIPN